MAAITPDSIVHGNLGSFRLVIAQFTVGTADDGDTWASGLSGIVDFWSQFKDDPTQTAEGGEISESSATFTFNLAEDNKPFSLFVLLRS